MIPLILLSSLTAWYRTTVSCMQVSAKSIFWLDFGGYKFFHLTWHKSVFGIKIDSQPLADEISSERIPTSPSLLLSKVSLFILSYSMRFYCGCWTWNYFKVFLYILTDLIFMVSDLEKLETGIFCEIFWLRLWFQKRQETLWSLKSIFTLLRLTKLSTDYNRVCYCREAIFLSGSK